MNGPKTPVKPPPKFVTQPQGVTQGQVSVVQAKVAVKGPAPFVIQAKAAFKVAAPLAIQTKVAFNVPPVYRPAVASALQAKISPRSNAPVACTHAPTVPPVFHPKCGALVQAKLGAQVSPLAVGVAPIQMASRGNSEKQEKQAAAAAGTQRSKTRKIEKTVKNAVTYGGIDADVAREYAQQGGYIPGHRSADSNSNMNNGTAVAIAAATQYARDARNRDDDEKSSGDELSTPRPASAAASSSTMKHSEEQKATAALVKDQKGIDKARKKHTKYHIENKDAPIGKKCVLCRQLNLNGA